MPNNGHSYVQSFLAFLEVLLESHEFDVVWTGIGYEIGGKITSQPQIL
jgi:hypothetical protein